MPVFLGFAEPVVFTSLVKASLRSVVGCFGIFIGLVGYSRLCFETVFLDWAVNVWPGFAGFLIPNSGYSLLSSSRLVGQIVSILTLPLAPMLTGSGSFALQRTRVYRVIVELVFPLVRAREWSLMLRSADVWTSATQEELDDETQSLLGGGAYQPPASMKVAAASETDGVWQPEIADKHAADDSAAVESRSELSVPGPVERARDDLPQLGELGQIEQRITIAKDRLAKASEYGGGVDFAGKAVRPRADSKRPASVLKEVWARFSDQQKADKEAELEALRTQLRSEKDDLEKLWQ